MIKTSKKIILIKLFCLSFLWNIGAQEWMDTTEIHYQPRFALKYAPLAMLSTTSAIQFGAELRIFPYQSVQVEYGYVNDFNLFGNDFDGFKLKTEYRFYSPLRKIRPNSIFKERSKNDFVGIQYFRKRFDARGNGTVLRANGNFQEIIPLEVRNISNSFFIVYGKVLPINERFHVENVFGIGGRSLTATVIGLPEDGTLNGNIGQGWLFDLTDGEGNFEGLDMFFSFKLIYAFN